MTNKKIAGMLETQVPSHIREDYPLFMEFIKRYYEFMDQDSGAVGSLSKLLYNTDIDNMDDQFLIKLKQELALPLSVAKQNSKVFSSNIKDFYLARGTEESFRILFRLLFNEEIIITYPREQILRASDGRWTQESFVTIDTVWGHLSVEKPIDFKFAFTNEETTIEATATRVEQIASGKYRAYFNFLYKIEFAAGDRVSAYDMYDVEFFSGVLLESPAEAKIISEGKYWQKGKVITVAMEGKDTIARVTRVGPEGQLKALEILEYGYPHIPGVAYYVSPYRKPPQKSVVDIESVVTSVSPITYSHTVQIQDVVDSFNERLKGYISNDGTSSAYFLDDYCSEEYTGRLAIEYEDVIVSYPQITQEVSYTTWVESRTTLEFKFMPMASMVGYWEGDRGKLSNPHVKLQDNYLYQIFSYLIDTASDMNAVNAIQSMVNPSGLKAFFNSNKQTIVDFDNYIRITRTISNEKLYFSDFFNMGESYTQDTLLPREDFIVSFSDGTHFDTSLAKSDSFDSQENYLRDIRLNKNDSSVITDAQHRNIITNLSDGSGITDAISSKSMDRTFADGYSPIEEIRKTRHFEFDDVFDVTTIAPAYAADFFGEAYTNEGEENIVLIT